MGLIGYFIGAAEQRRGHGEAEHSGGLRIDDQQLRRLGVSGEPVMAGLRSVSTPLR